MCKLYLVCIAESKKIKYKNYLLLSKMLFSCTIKMEFELETTNLQLHFFRPIRKLSIDVISARLLTQSVVSEKLKLNRFEAAKFYCITIPTTM